MNVNENNNNSIFVGMLCSLAPPKVEPFAAGLVRINQISNGISSFYSKLREPLKKVNPIVSIIENTLPSNGGLPQAIINSVPIEFINNFAFFLTKENNFGFLNKGAGMMENWLWCKDFMKEYEWYIHHEPRQLVGDPTFLEKCLLEPKTRFAHRGDYYLTGTFCMKMKDLFRFLSDVQIVDLVKQSIGIEYAMKEWVEKNLNLNEIEFAKDAGVDWIDGTTGIVVRM